MEGAQRLLEELHRHRRENFSDAEVGVMLRRLYWSHTPKLIWCRCFAYANYQGSCCFFGGYQRTAPSLPRLFGGAANVFRFVLPSCLWVKEFVAYLERTQERHFCMPYQHNTSWISHGGEVRSGRINIGGSTVTSWFPVRVFFFSCTILFRCTPGCLP